MDKFLVDDFFEEQSGPTCICFLAIWTGLDAQTIIQRLKILLEDHKIQAQPNGNCWLFDLTQEYRKHLSDRQPKLFARTRKAVKTREERKVN